MVIGVEVGSLSWSAAVEFIFESLDRRLMGDSRRARRDEQQGERLDPARIVQSNYQA